MTHIYTKHQSFLMGTEKVGATLYACTMSKRCTILKIVRTYQNSENNNENHYQLEFYLVLLFLSTDVLGNFFVNIEEQLNRVKILMQIV
ncbi:hypothetical protein [Peribacillus asahii]|uniref:hypothetical protein n=1 Tax=Peribacillus asahii TaxID=228899 RepID=UPI00207A0FFD|nr:hypothetical protein [Peribacillus asahii]USK60337.1 hypothetical protein LIT37_03000 [Peribacillus asahii]